MKIISVLQKAEIERLEKLRFEYLKDKYSSPPVFLTEEEIKKEASTRVTGYVKQELFSTEDSLTVDATLLHSTLSEILKWAKNATCHFSVSRGCETCGHGEIVKIILNRDQTFEELCQKVYNEDRKSKDVYVKKHEEYKKLAKKYG